MNQLMKVIAVTVLLFFGLNLTVSAQAKKDETVKIKTSAICGSCKTRIEKGLADEKGIKEATLDLKTKIVTVKYSPSQTNPDQIRKAVSLMGYDADDVKKDQKAFDKLPACCQSESQK